jgi:hypothetical protein
LWSCRSRKLQRARQPLSARHHLFDQPDAKGSGRIDPLAAQHHAVSMPTSL